MAIHGIFHKRRRVNSRPRPRRPSSTAFSPVLLSLEDRIPLSVDLTVSIPASHLPRTLDVDVYNAASAATPDQWTLLDISVDVDGTKSGTFQADAPSLLLAVNPGPSQETDGTVLELAAGATSVGTLSATNPVEEPSPTAEEASVPTMLAETGQGSGSLAFQNRPLLNLAAQTLAAGGTVEFVGRADDWGQGPPMPPDPFFAGLLDLAPWRPGAFVNNGEGDDTSGDDGPMGTLESGDNPSAWPTTPMANTRTSGRASSSSISDGPVASASSDEPSSGLSYLATTESPTQPQATDIADDVRDLNEDSAEPIDPASITLGGVSLSILLNDSNIGRQTEQANLEQVAELVPLPDSSLALAATLWSVPSDSRASLDKWRRPAEMTVEQDSHNSTAASWAVFVIGMDQSLEHTCRNIQEAMRSADDNPTSSPRRVSAAHELIDWNGPIIPIGRYVQPENQPKSPPTKRPATPDEAPRAIVPSFNQSRAEFEDQPPVAVGMVPAISVVSASTLIASWLWRKRRQRQKSPSPKTTPSSR